jgi:ketosteroid isomerase-like protein
MSRENVEMAEGFLTAYNRRDFDQAMQHFDPQIEWVLPAMMGFDSCVGCDQVMRFFQGLDESWDELRLDALESVDAGDRVATRLYYHGRGKRSGAEIDTELYHQVAFFREGRIVRMEYVESWPAALELAGVES